jgi:hypothetical protein
VNLLGLMPASPRFALFSGASTLAFQALPVIITAKRFAAWVGCIQGRIRYCRESGTAYNTCPDMDLRCGCGQDSGFPGAVRLNRWSAVSLQRMVWRGPLESAASFALTGDRFMWTLDISF